MAPNDGCNKRGKDVSLRVRVSHTRNDVKRHGEWTHGPTQEVDGIPLTTTA